MIDQESMRAACLVIMDVADIVKTTRAARGLSQAKAAAEIGIGQTTVEHLEQGRGVRTDTLLMVLDWATKGEA